MPLSYFKYTRGDNLFHHPTRSHGQRLVIHLEGGGGTKWREAPEIFLLFVCLFVYYLEHVHTTHNSMSKYTCKHVHQTTCP